MSGADFNHLLIVLLILPRYQSFGVCLIYDRDAYLICCVDTLTSIFAGFVIFAILGVTAKEKGTDVANVVESSKCLKKTNVKLLTGKKSSFVIWLNIELAVNVDYTVETCLV